MSENDILVEKKNGLAKVTLNIPEKRNALTMDRAMRLVDIFESFRDDATIKVIVLTGSGKAFSAGGDVTTMLDETAVNGRRRLKKGQRLVKTMNALEKPIIAAVNGVTAGAGVSIALASDIIIASDKAKFIISQIKIGLTPDWGQCYFLPLRDGVARAKHLMFKGDPIDATTAERIGMVDMVVPHDQLEEEAMSFAGFLVKGPTEAYAMIKMALNRWPTNLETMLEIESTMSGIALSSQDAGEGCRAFMEKRPPEYQGC